MESVNIRICNECNQIEGVVKFQGKYRKVCTKCNSKMSNERIKMKNPAYFKLKMKECYVYHGKVGRPKKCEELVL